MTEWTLCAGNLAARLIASGAGDPDTIIGCNEVEIRQIEASVGVHLPERYKEFLRVAGKCAGAFWIGSEWLYPELCGLTAKARDLVEEMEEGGLVLPERAFVWSIPTDEAFLFFECNEGVDDAPSYLYYIDNHSFTPGADSFWHVLEHDLCRYYTPTRRADPHFKRRLAMAKARAAWLKT